MVRADRRRGAREQTADRKHYRDGEHHRDGSVGWAAIRTAPLDKQMLPLCGMDISPSGTIRTEANNAYPYLDAKTAEKTPKNLEAHFKSLLRFSADQASQGTGIPVEYRQGQCYYTDALEYVEENGIYSYGCFISASPETILALIESGAVTSVWIEDAWINV